MARTASFLADSGLVLNSDAQALFVDAVGDNLYQALTLLQKRAEGDYTADSTPESFPAYTGTLVGRACGLDCWQLFENFVSATQPAASTVKRWRAVFLNLKAEFPHSADAITDASARAWASKLVTAQRTASTVKEVWIPAVRRVFSWAEKQSLTRKNPFGAVTVDVPKKARDRETKAFKPEEVRMILSATHAFDKSKNTFQGAKRWVMWLCAYSGARAGEVTQLRGIDVQKRGAFYVMRLTPEAGTIKTGEARVVPIHDHLIEQGFLQFVQERGRGPLFYNDPAKKTGKSDPLNPSRPPAMPIYSERGRLSIRYGMVSIQRRF